MVSVAPWKGGRGEGLRRTPREEAVFRQHRDGVDEKNTAVEEPAEDHEEEHVGGWALCRGGRGWCRVV